MSVFQTKEKLPHLLMTPDSYELTDLFILTTDSCELTDFLITKRAKKDNQ